MVRTGKHILSYDVKIYDGSGDLIAKCVAAGFQTDVPLPD